MSDNKIYKAGGEPEAPPGHESNTSKTDVKKFLDYEGLKHLWSKINMNDYPNNETLMAVINAIDETKVDKVDGKGLSTNDFTNEYKEKLNDLENITFEETDPTVPAWAKAATKPTYTANEVGALPADTVIPTYEVATQEQDGLIPALSGDKNTFLRGDGVWGVPSSTGGTGGITYTAGNGIEIDADNCITNTGVLNVSVPDSDPETGEIPIGSFKANINGTDTSISINGVETAYTASMTNVPGALTWDGSIGDRYYIEMQNEGGMMSVGFVHITDEFPATLNLMLQMGGEESESIPVSMCVNIEGSVEYGETTLTVSEDGFIMGDEEAFIIYVPTDNYTHPEMPVTFAKKGWYGMGYYYIIEGQYIPMMNMPSIMKIPMVSFTSSNGDMSKYFTTETSTTIGSPVQDTLTWDGNIDGRYSTGYIGLTYVYMGDINLTNASGNTDIIVTSTSDSTLTENIPNCTTEINGTSCFLIVSPSDSDGGPQPLAIITLVDDYVIEGILNLKYINEEIYIPLINYLIKLSVLNGDITFTEPITALIYINKNRPCIARTT